MRKRVFGRKFSRDSSGRKALFRSLVVSLLKNGAIETTLARAKAVSGWVDKLVTTAKKGDLASRRRVIAELSSQEAGGRLTSEIVPLMLDRASGFTRIIKLGPRRGDGAPRARLEFVVAIPAKEKESQEQRRPSKAEPKVVKSKSLKPTKRQHV